MRSLCGHDPQTLCGPDLQTLCGPDLQTQSSSPLGRCELCDQDLLGELALVLVVVHAVVGDGRQLAAAVVLVVDVVGHVLQVLHVGSGNKRLVRI